MHGFSSLVAKHVPFFFHQEVEQVEQFSLQVKNMDDDIIVKFLMDPTCHHFDTEVVIG